MDYLLCVTVLQEMIETYGEPANYNSGWGSQFPCDAFIPVLSVHSINISMDSKERALDNVSVERL